MKKYLAILMLLPFSAQANKPIYMNPVPSSFCIPVSQVEGKIKSCNDNTIFAQAGQSCLRDIKKLRQNVAGQLKKNFSNPNARQNEQFQGNVSDNNDAAAAHQYMIAVAKQAINDLDPYFDYMEHPEHADTDEEVWQEACYRESAVALDKVMEELEDMVEEMEKAKSIEELHSAISGKHEHGLDYKSLKQEAGPAKTSGQGAGTVQGRPKGSRDSDISGIKEDEDARKKAPK